MKRQVAPEDGLRDREDLVVHDEPGAEHVYVPGVILVDARDEELVAPLVAEAGGEVGKSGVEGVVRFDLPRDVDVIALTARLRASSEERTPRVGPAQVLFGFPRLRGWPGSDPEPAGELDVREAKGGGAGAGVRVVVIDTGLDDEARRTSLLAGVLADDPDDIDLTVDVAPQDGFIDDQAGHGAFVAGIIRQEAPGAEVRVIRALSTEGIADELTVARAIDRAAAAGADIINLSLGGYTDGDRAPLAISAALGRLPRTTAVVVAAGNFASSRPTWPAAHKRVLSVGATDDDGNRAEFSNWGWWVDVCAPGVDVHSVYVRGDERPDVETDRNPDSFDGYAVWSGTSFSAPRVAARIAVEMSRTGGSARAAVARLVEDPAAPFVPDVGVLIG